MLTSIIDNTAYPESSGSSSEFIPNDDGDGDDDGGDNGGGNSDGDGDSDGDGSGSDNNDKKGADEVERARDSESQPRNRRARCRKNVQLREQSQPIPADLSDLTIDGHKATNDEAEYIRTYFHMCTQLGVEAAQRLGISVAMLKSMGDLGLQSTRTTNPWDGFKIRFNKSHSKPAEICEMVYASIAPSCTEKF